MSLDVFNTDWVANWQKIQKKAGEEKVFRQQLISEPRKTVANWEKSNGKGLPLVDNLALHINPDPNERFAQCVLSPILAVPHPTEKWTKEWPGIVDLITGQGDNAKRAKLFGDTNGFLSDLGLELLKHVRYSIDDDATAHVVVMPLQRPDLPVSDQLKAIMEAEKALDPSIDANGPYASSCCC